MNPSFSHIKMVAIDCDENFGALAIILYLTIQQMYYIGSQQKGVAITIATGRMYQTAKPIGQALKLVMCR